MRRRMLGAVLPLVLVAASAVALPVAAEAAPVSGLTKSVQGTGSPADHGATANWVIGYDDQATGSGAATITDAVGAGQAFQSGSLHAPPGWTPSWSTDGTTFTGTEPASGVTAVRASNPDAGPDATSLSGALTPPVQAVTTATGGDGFSPILYRTPGGALQAWNIYHHLGATSPKVVCTDLATGQRCPGGPWPKVLNTAPGPLGTLGAGDIASTMVEQYVHDPAAPAKVYYPAVTASSVGVGCLDMAASANCGYWALSPTGGSPAVNSIGGFVENSGNLYGIVSSGAVVCWTIATQSACGGQPYAPIVPAANQPYVYGGVTVAAGKVFASTSNPGTGQQPTLGCFDPATATACANWASARPTGPAGNYNYNDYTAFDTSGASVGACATTTGSPDVTTCYALDGSALAAPPGPAALPAGVYAFPPEVVTDPAGHVRSYLPIWNGGYAGAALCHDWTTGAACAGLPGPISHPTVNGGATRDYGYSYDPPSGCLIGLGDAGVLFSMDPATGATPCVRSGGQVTLKPGDFYCDGGSHVQGYTAARLTGVDPANVDFAASRVTVVDQDGVTVPTPGFAPDGSVDLTGVSVAAHPSITVTTTLVLHSAAGFAGRLVVDYVGDAPQLCFRTTISADCAVSSVANTASGTDSTGSFTSNTVTLPVAPGASCTPNVKVEKEICKSSTPAKCGPGGAGPWVKQAGVGLLGLLNATAYWRITVTNLGPVGITSAHVVDSVEPSCQTGDFTLAANQSKQVYCSTYALLSLFPITNQAKVSYLPANVPPGTPPSHTGWSSATACSLLCIL
ncbi:hypothetical protein SAMN05421837_10165 [Amycolatopsis pretoriensis]|uniref:DUF7617 domain-containing protein n=1 Tax=Amycolatopsis pretoriensis TaxID=218821 RepID=A0A1H5Q2M4_9PSEU|nr:hypothetical protein [Amycolatopsis pretoriensis]SEF19698.1 hypothetical protein SAMN05421837_10165 [Amycolatopsis pretoriensis]